jgi:hypothetical protein
MKEEHAREGGVLKLASVISHTECEERIRHGYSRIETGISNQTRRLALEP